MQQFRIRKPALFNFNETLWFLDRNLDDCMHRVIGDRVYRLFSSAGKPALVSICEEGDELKVTVEKGRITDASKLIQFIIEWFDLERDIRPFYQKLKKDPDLAFMLKKYSGFRMVGIPDLFESLCWCVIGQQINLAFAYKVKRVLVEKYGLSVNHLGQRWFLFPAPEVLKEIKIEEYREMQLTTRKAEYIKGIAELFCKGNLSKKKLIGFEDENLMRQELMRIRGIGEWTANYAVMKSLRGMDCIPYGDSGINNALFQLKDIPKKNNRAQVDEVFTNFEGWKSYLVFYLWRSQRERSVN